MKLSLNVTDCPWSGPAEVALFEEGSADVISESRELVMTGRGGQGTVEDVLGSVWKRQTQLTGFGTERRLCLQ